MTAMMAPYYEILNITFKMVSLAKGIRKNPDTQKYITSLFLHV